MYHLYYTRPGAFSQLADPNRRNPIAETLPNWRKGCTPHRDIREDAVSEALFAVNLSRAIAREGAVMRGAAAELTPEQVRFSGWLIGEEVPLPVTADEVARLTPKDGRLAVQALYQQAVDVYGVERVTSQGLLDAVGRWWS